VTNGAGRITGELPPRPPGGVTPVATVQSQALAPPRVPRVAKENGAPEVAARPSSPRDTVEDGGFHAEAAPTAPGHKDVFDLRREVHRRLRDSAELAQLESRSGSHDATARARVHAAIRRMVRAFEGRLPPGHDVELLATELTSEAVGLGPLEELLADPTVRAIVVDDAASVFVEREGAPLLPTSARFTDTERVRLCLERLLTHAHAPAPVAHRPLVDVRLADGTRLSALLPPLARRGVSFSLRRPPPKAPTLEALAERGVLSVQVARFLARVVLAQKNIVVTGPALSGKTQVTSALAAAAPLEERFVVFEGDEAIVLPQRHVVAVEATPVFAAGALGVSARATFAAALRLRPQRVVAAAVPGGAALDVLQAMSAGTCPWILEVAGRSPREALARLETQALLRAPEMPSRPLRDLLAAGAQVVVHVGRAAAGRSAVVSVSEVVGTRDEVGFTLTPIFEAKAPGEPLKATGHIPGFLEDFVTAGLVRDGEPPL
jgi:pilus assembly protein CpaF